MGKTNKDSGDKSWAQLRRESRKRKVMEAEEVFAPAVHGSAGKLEGEYRAWKERRGIIAPK